jgi:hypothetical protein
MNEEFEIDRKIGFVKSPWIGVPAPEQPCEFQLEEWLPRQRSEGKIYFYDLRQHSVSPTAILDDEPAEGLEKTFRELASQWKDETWFVSSIRKRISNPAFLKIIGLGRPAIPLILDELRREPDYWSYALEAISRQDPAPGAQNLMELRDAWLVWGKAHGY